MQSKILLMLLLFTFDLFAVEGTMRVKLQSHENLYTSQKVIVAVELLTNAFSITDARITFPSSVKYIVNAPKSAAYIRTEEINGTDWQMVHYEYEVYALQAGEIEVSPVKTTFSASMGYGQPKKAFTLKSKAFHFSVRSPKGLKQEQFVLVTDHYILTQKRDLKKSELIVGDAIEVKIIQKAHGVPDILLKPIHYKSTPELRVYEKEPVLQSGLKGRYDVSRTDSFTFVAAAEGNVTVPEQQTVWWESSSEKVRVETLPAIHFIVIADPQIALDAKKAKQKKILLYVVFSIIALLLLYKFFAPSLKHCLYTRKKRYEASEKGLFEHILVSEENREIYQTFYVWLQYVDLPLSKCGFKCIAVLQPSFASSLSALEKSLVSKEEKLDKMLFINEAEKLRTLLLKKHKQPHLSFTLNP